jgi:nucleoid DNA-binding protein
VEATIEEITAQLAVTRSIHRLRQVLDRRPSGAEGRNPQPGDSLQIAAKTAAKFSPGAELEKDVNDWGALDSQRSGGLSSGPGSGNASFLPGPAVCFNSRTRERRWSNFESHA